MKLFWGFEMMYYTAVMIVNFLQAFYGIITQFSRSAVDCKFFSNFLPMVTRIPRPICEIVTDIDFSDFDLQRQFGIVTDL